MFTWHNKKAKKSTIIGYLSRKYTLEQLASLPTNSVLELPDNFESPNYFLELNQILADSPWQKVKYVASSTSSIKSLANSWKDRLFGKKPVTEEIKSKELDWKNIDRNFNEELVREWTDQSFTYQQTKEWIDIGLSINDFDFCAWLRDQQGNTAEELLNYGDIEQSRAEFNQELASDSETSSLNSDTSMKTVKFNPHLKHEESEGETSDSSSVKSATNSEENISDSEKSEEFTTYKGTFHYEFCTDDQGLILTWRTPSSFWRDDNFYETKYFATDIAKHANSYLKIKTLKPLPLPRNLPKSKVLFSPCWDEKEFYQAEDNWDKCLIWEQEPLKQCENCPTYLIPTTETNLVNICVKCSQEQESETYSELFQEDWWQQDWTNQSNQPSKSFWERNKKLLIVLGLAVIGGVIIYNWNQN